MDKVNPAMVKVDSDEDEKMDSQRIYVIQSGKILEDKNIKYLSEEYVEYLLKKFHLRDHITKKADESKNCIFKNSQAE
jgi:hypothetical protein